MRLKWMIKYHNNEISIEVEYHNNEISIDD